MKAFTPMMLIQEYATNDSIIDLCVQEESIIEQNLNIMMKQALSEAAMKREYYTCILEGKFSEGIRTVFQAIKKSLLFIIDKIIELFRKFTNHAEKTASDIKNTKPSSNNNNIIDYDKEIKDNKESLERHKQNLKDLDKSFPDITKGLIVIEQAGLFIKCSKALQDAIYNSSIDIEILKDSNLVDKFYESIMDYFFELQALYKLVTDEYAIKSSISPADITNTIFKYDKKGDKYLIADNFLNNLKPENFEACIKRIEDKLYENEAVFFTPGKKSTGFDEFRDAVKKNSSFINVDKKNWNMLLLTSTQSSIRFEGLADRYNKKISSVLIDFKKEITTTNIDYTAKYTIEEKNGKEYIQYYNQIFKNYNSFHTLVSSKLMEAVKVISYEFTNFKHYTKYITFLSTLSNKYITSEIIEKQEELNKAYDKAKENNDVIDKKIIEECLSIRPVKTKFTYEDYLGKNDSVSESVTMFGEEINSDIIFNNGDYRDFNRTEWMDLALESNYNLNMEILETDTKHFLNECVLLASNESSLMNITSLNEEVEEQKKNIITNSIKALEMLFNKFIESIKNNKNKAFLDQYKDIILNKESKKRVPPIKLHDYIAAIDRINKASMPLNLSISSLQKPFVSNEQFFKDYVLNTTCMPGVNTGSFKDGTSIANFCKTYFFVDGVEDKAFESFNYRNIYNFLYDNQKLLNIAKADLSKVKSEADKLVNMMPKKEENNETAANEAYSIVKEAVLIELTNDGAVQNPETLKDKTSSVDGTNTDSNTSKNVSAYVNVARTFYAAKFTAISYFTSELMALVKIHVGDYTKIQKPEQKPDQKPEETKK